MPQIADAKAECGADGSYTLELTEPGPYLILCESPRLVPGVTHVDVVLGETTRASDVYLESGESLRGNVGDLDAARRSTCLVECEGTPELRRPEEHALWVEGQLFFWGASGVYKFRVQSPLDSAGRFELLGLRPGKFTLRVRPLWRNANFSVARQNLRDAAVAVASSDGILVQPSSAVLHLRWGPKEGQPRPELDHTLSISSTATGEELFTMKVRDQGELMGEADAGIPYEIELRDPIQRIAMDSVTLTPGEERNVELRVQAK